MVSFLTLPINFYYIHECQKYLYPQIFTYKIYIVNSLYSHVCIRYHKKWIENLIYIFKGTRLNFKRKRTQFNNRNIKNPNKYKNENENELKIYI